MDVQPGPMGGVIPERGNTWIRAQKTDDVLRRRGPNLGTVSGIGARGLRGQ